MTEEERDLIERHHLSRAQIGFRRKVRANFRGLARQEFAEDAESCFRAAVIRSLSLPPIEQRLGVGAAAVELRRNGELEIWLPPLPGKQYLVAVDPAGGGSEGDYSPPRCWSIETGLQCAEFAGHVGGLELARLVTAFATNTTMRGSWWSATTTAAACWR